MGVSECPVLGLLSHAVGARLRGRKLRCGIPIGVLALKAPKAVWQLNTLENHHVELLVVNHQTKRVIYTIVYYNIYTIAILSTL